MRKCDDWLKSWMEFSAGWESPERFRLWSGIAAVSAMCQRKVFTYVKGQRLYANTYILLIGSPGSGKGNAMKYLANWLKEMKGEFFNMAPDGITQRAFYMVLEDSGSIPGGDVNYEQHALTAFIEELGVFLPPGDNKFTYALCHIYDCPPKFEYKTAHAGENSAVNASFSMLSACTPKALRDIFTEDAMELGISARTIIIFADDKVEVEIFGKRDQRDRLEKDLRDDLIRMLRVTGDYQFEDAAAQALVSWSKSGFTPVPKDPRFEHYNSRRFVQVVKLCMIFALSRRDDPVILLDDFNAVKTILLEAERFMPRAIETLGANPLLAQQQYALKHINEIFNRLKRGTQESELISALARDVSPHLIESLIDSISNAKWVTASGSHPNRLFFPRGKEKKE